MATETNLCRHFPIHRFLNLLATLLFVCFAQDLSREILLELRISPLPFLVPARLLSARKAGDQ
jgi:hypothetical protein